MAGLSCFWGLWLWGLPTLAELALTTAWWLLILLLVLLRRVWLLLGRATVGALGSAL